MSSTPYITRGNTHIFWHAELSCSYAPVRKRYRDAVKREREREKQELAAKGLEVPKEVRRVDSANLRRDESDEPVAQTVVKTKVPAGAEIKQLKATRTHTQPSSVATPKQVLTFLLSPAAAPYANTASISPDQTAYEHLLAAVILSRPLPHSIAQRILTTLFSSPLSLRTPLALKTTPTAKFTQALLPFRTSSTAKELDFLVSVLSNNNWHNDLARLRANAPRAREAEREVLRISVKGLGKGGLEVFLRKVQVVWGEVWPFVDDEASGALEKLGVRLRAEGLVRMLEGVEGDEEEKRTLFVEVLERAVGVDREGRVRDVLERAARL